MSNVFIELDPRGTISSNELWKMAGCAFRERRSSGGVNLNRFMLSRHKFRPIVPENNERQNDWV